ncbi:protein kinase [Pendulispora rubella]|uniref:Protein kinase n=1 Tax=Pendulispora rubella TaxID=2741070 RepID=A0ABZ2KV13_9BACT
MSDRRQGGGANAENPMNARGPQHSSGGAGGTGGVVGAARQSGPDPLIGRTINGRYRIDAVIARGGMGKVYRAEQAPLGRVCALKILSPRYDGEDDPEFRRRFFLEASTAAKLTHSNTVTIFDYGKSENEEIYYIAMEYIEGRTLSIALRDDGPLPEERVRHIAAQICRSLREAHGLGVVHRDLKPGNIMLTNKGDERDNVKVLDFGLVKDVTTDAQDHTQEGVFMGSPKYMAPEQILGLALTPRADVYSLGIMLFEMLTGKVPYDRGGANIATLMAHVNDPLPNMHSMAPSLAFSPQMEAIVYRCLEKDPARRFASMSALLLAIKGLSEDGSIDVSGPFASPRHPFLSPDQPSGPHGAAAHGLGPGVRPHIPVPPSSEKTVLVRRPDDPPVLVGSTGRKALIGVLLGGTLLVGAGAVAAVVHLMSQQRESAAAMAATPPAHKAPNASAQEVAAPAPVAPSASAAPRVIHVESDPPGAIVSEDGQELCASTPCDVMLSGQKATREHRFTMEKKGFKPSPLSVDPRAESISVTLVPVAVPQSPRKRPDVPKGDPGSSFKPDPYKPDPY